MELRYRREYATPSDSQTPPAAFPPAPLFKRLQLYITRQACVVCLTSHFCTSRIDLIAAGLCAREVAETMSIVHDKCVLLLCHPEDACRRKDSEPRNPRCSA